VADDIVNTAKAPPPVGAYPHARRVGNLIFLSGVGPRQPGTSEIPGLSREADGRVMAKDIRKQTRATIENVKTILEAAGSSLDRVVDVMVFLTDMENDFAGYNEVYAEYFASIQATRTTIGVTALPTPIAVELKVIAEA
jgi:2-aminomuconate deaminase